MFGKVWTAARLCALSSGSFRLFYCLVLLLNSSQPWMKATLTAWNPCYCCCLSAGFITGEWLPLQWQQHGTVHWLVLYCIVLFNASRSNKETLFILSQCPGKAWVIFMWIGGKKMEIWINGWIKSQYSDLATKVKCNDKWWHPSFLATFSCTKG